MKHCPECNVEYQETALLCADCDVALVPGSPIEQSHPDVSLEVVYATGEPALIAIAKTLLDGADIQYLAKGDEILDLFGGGRFGTGPNYVSDPVEFYVASDDAAAARELLRHLDESVPESPVDEDLGT